MSYGGVAYAGGSYAGGGTALTDVPSDTDTHLAIEIAFTTGALEEPVWENVTGDVRSWSATRGRGRELERHQPGRYTLTLSNLDRQYDSENLTGPHHGNLKPMKRIRQRETFNGVTYPVWDGFIDGWKLDYPGSNKDATATVTATDAFKIFARTDMPRSVYTLEVEADDPVIWWRLDEQKSHVDDGDLLALNHGTMGSAGDGTYSRAALFGASYSPPEQGGEGLVVKDPGSSMITKNSFVTSVPLGNGVVADNAAFDIATKNPYVVEAWCVPRINSVGTKPGFLTLWDADIIGANTPLALVIDVTDNRFEYSVEDATARYTAVSATGISYGSRYHVVAKLTLGSPLELWVNGVRTTGTGPTGQLPAGPFSSGDLLLGMNGGLTPGANWDGFIADAAVYTGAEATAVNQAWVDRHYAAGTAPWRDDQPEERIDRILDIAEWPSSLRQLDSGNAALQSASLDTVALEHIQQATTTEFGLLFMSRGGSVRFISRASQFARLPVQGVVIGDNTTTEVDYASISMNEADDTIRNRAIISRLNGVAKRAVDQTSIDEHGRFDYRLEGLLHRLDSFSQDYADFIVAEYPDVRRRVEGLTLITPPVGREALVYPVMLGLELGDVVAIDHRPPGGGATFGHSVIEGISHSGTPKFRTTTFTLSPDFIGSF